MYSPLPRQYFKKGEHKRKCARCGEYFLKKTYNNTDKCPKCRNGSVITDER